MKRGKPLALLIDGNSLAYRAFYALPDTMKTSKGIGTNAVYGFTNTLIKALLDDKPDFAAVAFDRKEPTFRHLEYKEYKATRDKAPPTLYDQMPYVREAVEALGIPVLEKAGFEADDIIGTLAKKCEKEGYEVVILSGDKDSLQLITENIKLLTMRKGITDTVLYDEKAVEEKYSLRPDQMIDLKALKGDASDNIPGIKGIGEKTAITLLKEFSTLENLLDNAGSIKREKTRQLVEQGKESALLSKRLGAIKTDVELDVEIKPQKIDITRAAPFFEKMEFSSLAKKYSGKTASESLREKREMISQYDYICVQDEKELRKLINELEKCGEFAFDTETTGLDAFEVDLVGISFCAKYGKAYYLPISKEGGKSVFRLLKPILESKKLKIGHNIKYDIEVLLKYGINVAPPYFDTMIAAWLLDPTKGGYGLKKAGKEYLDRDMIRLDELIGKDAEHAGFAEVPLDVATDYAAADADVTFGLYDIFKQELKKEGLEKVFYEVEMPLIPAVIEMEKNGVSLDTKKLKKMSGDMEERLKKLEKDIFCIAGEEFNINSPKQLAVVLFDKLKLPVRKSTKSGPSTDAEVLEELAADNFEIAEKLLEYRQLSKLKSTYVDVLPGLISKTDGRVHASFNQSGTATGRFSSYDPNLQNIPPEVRSAFVPGQKGWLILSADYSQVELRILAHLSKDPSFVYAFRKNNDIHKATAADIFDVDELLVTDEMRSAAKTVNFGIIYGISEFGLAKQLKIKKTEAAKFIDNYFKKHKGVKEFMDGTVEQAKQTGIVRTLLGRLRRLPDINSPNYGLRSFTERTAINTPVQGTAADMIKLAMIRVYGRVK
ncbi:MAG: DNA polymerase I, partial [Candidatus Margulisbacteria bacterium]|nr:DNA polymerase I [Candidatus Margulisiibacteriota bacterium]